MKYSKLSFEELKSGKFTLTFISPEDLAKEWGRGDKNINTPYTTTPRMVEYMEIYAKEGYKGRVNRVYKGHMPGKLPNGTPVLYSLITLKGLGPSWGLEHFHETRHLMGLPDIVSEITTSDLLDDYLKLLT